MSYPDADTVGNAIRSLVVVAFRKSGGGCGSGSIIRHGKDHSLVLTAQHVVGRKRVGALTFRSGSVFSGDKFRVVKTDRHNDLALLKTNRRLGVPTIPLAAREPALYTRLVVAGCPGDDALFGTAKDCRLVAANGSNGWTNKNEGYQISEPVGVGTSGGMLFNEGGHLVGVPITGIDTTFTAFCVPLPIIRKFLLDYDTCQFTNAEVK